MNPRNQFLSLILCVSFLSLASSCWAENALFKFDFEELSPGVWAGVRAESQRFPVMGNATFVISNEGVVVFDGGGLPIMATQVIEQIRSLTDLPVTHVIISHWHGDHFFGAYRFAEEFENVQYIAHSFTDAAIHGDPVDYISGYSTFAETTVPVIEKRVKTGKHESGDAVSATDILTYKQLLLDAPAIAEQYKKARLVKPTLSFDDKMIIHSGSTRIELMKLGHGNTEGDIIMWLPDAKIVASGDLVVHPTPYAFNVPPRPWAQSLKNLNSLGYQVLVPGHGEIQTDTSFVDLNIEVAISIADQRDQMLADGISQEEVAEKLDFSAFEQRFTGGDEYTKRYYNSWFEQPFRKAAIKALGDEPMKAIGPSKRK